MFCFFVVQFCENYDRLPQTKPLEPPPFTAICSRKTCTFVPTRGPLALGQGPVGPSRSSARDCRYDCLFRYRSDADRTPVADTMYGAPHSTPLRVPVRRARVYKISRRCDCPPRHFFFFFCFFSVDLHLKHDTYTTRVRYRYVEGEWAAKYTRGRVSRVRERCIIIIM